MTLAALEIHLADAMAERLAALKADDGAPVFAAVLSALDTAALTSWPKTPAALVLPISDEAEGSTTRRVEGTPVQHVVRVGVSLMVAAPNDPTTAAVRAGGGASLCPACSPAPGRRSPAGRRLSSARWFCRFRRGRLVSLEDGRLQWLDEYEIRRVARAGVIEARRTAFAGSSRPTRPTASRAGAAARLAGAGPGRRRPHAQQPPLLTPDSLLLEDGEGRREMGKDMNRELRQ